MTRSIGLVTWGGAVLAFALGGCNAVMGIDEAELRTDEAGGGTSGAAGSAMFSPESRASTQLSVNCAQPTAACATCMAGSDCESDRARCLESTECRNALNQYRICLGTQCLDAGSQCLQRFQAFENTLFPGRLGFAGCVAAQCAAECAHVPLATPCELYCSCMNPGCAAELAQELPPTKAITAECMAQCESDPAPDLINCRWTHCERSFERPNEGHCLHALGQGNCNANVSIINTCTDKSQTSFACKVGQDCCSGKCTRDVCE